MLSVRVTTALIHACFRKLSDKFSSKIRAKQIISGLPITLQNGLVVKEA
jgi:hypothetical protein